MLIDRRIVVFIFLQLSMGIAAAAMEAVTEDGKRVRLLDDHTWEFIDADNAATVETAISIEVISKVDRQGKCIFGLRLQNNAEFRIDSLVPQFTAHVNGDVKYENLFVGFQRIKPTQNQYQEAAFSRITCAEITRITVHGGDRCAMGELTRFSSDKGVCLQQVKIVPSALVPIGK